MKTIPGERVEGLNVPGGEGRESSPVRRGGGGGGEGGERWGSSRGIAYLSFYRLAAFFAAFL